MDNPNEISLTLYFKEVWQILLARCIIDSFLPLDELLGGMIDNDMLCAVR
jgi:hypothetical protein